MRTVRARWVNPQKRGYSAVHAAVPHRRRRRLLGVSDDTVRRWVDAGTLPVQTDASHRKVIDGPALAEFARRHANAAPDPSDVGRSARNRLVGLVTEVITDKVMAQVEMQCGPHRVVSLMSSEAVRELAWSRACWPSR